MFKEPDKLDPTVSKCTLEAVVAINGKRYAIICGQCEGGTTGNYKFWKDLSTGLVVKSESDCKAKNEVGEVADATLREDIPVRSTSLCCI